MKRLALVLALALAAAPRASAATLDDARTALADRRYADAASILGKLTLKEDDHRLYLLATAQTLAGKHADAAAALDELLARHPQSAWRTKALYKKADVLAKMGKFEEAQKIYEAQIIRLASTERRGEIQRVYLTHADQAFEPKLAKPKPGEPEPEERKPNYAAALKLYQRARELDALPAESDRIDLRIGLCQFHLKKFKEAVAQFEALLEKDAGPHHADALYHQGLSLMGLKDPDKARASFEKLLRDFPKNRRAPEALYKIAATYGLPKPGNESDLNFGARALRTFLGRHPGHELAPKAGLEVGLSFFNFRQYDKAIEELSKFVTEARKKDAPEVARAAYLVGQAHRKLNRFEKAIAAWQDYLRKFPAHEDWQNAQNAIVSARYDRASHLRKKKKWAEAAKAFKDFAAAYPLDKRNASALFMLGQIAFDQKKYPEAIAAWRRVVSKFAKVRDGHRAQFLLAQTLDTKLHDPEKAIEEYKKIAKGPYRNQAALRLRQLREPHLLVTYERIFHTDEKPKLKVETRNIEKVHFKAYRLNAEDYFRRMGELARIEELDIALIDPHQEWDAPVKDYKKHRDIESQIELPFKQPGLFAVNVSGEKLEATVMVLVTDLAILVKSSKKDVLVFAQNLRTGKPQPDAQLLLSDGKKVVLTGKTGENGIYQVESDDLKKVSRLRVYAASDGSPASNAFGLRRLGIALGLQPRGILYTDRPAYRPGQKVSYRGVLRLVTKGRFDAGGGREVTVRVISSRGGLVHEAKHKLSEFGSLAGDFTLNARDPLGRYRIVATTGEEEKKTTFTGQFRVDEYQLPLYRVVFDFPKSSYFRGELIKGKIRIEYFFGQPVAEKLVRYRLKDQRWQEKKTDDLGEVEVEFETDFFRETEPLPLRVMLPADGVTASKNILLATKEFQATVETLRRTYLVGERFDAKVKTTDFEGKPVGRKVTVGLYRFVGEDAAPAPEEADAAEPGRPPVGYVKVDSKMVNTAKDTGLATVGLTAGKEGGRHMVRVEGLDGRRNLVVAQRYLFVSGDDDKIKLRILSDSDEFRVGDTAEVTIVCRTGAATALLTWEGERIYRHRLQPLKKGANKVKIEIPEACAPNFTLAAAVLHDDKFHQARKGLAVLKVLKVVLTPSKAELLPGERVTVKLKTTDQHGKPAPAELSLAVVDEALYARYKDTLPKLGEFFQQRRTGRFYAAAASNGFQYRGRTKATSEALRRERDGAPRLRPPAASRRARRRRSPLTPWEKQILAKLKKPITFDFVETPLQDVLTFIAAQSDVTFVLDADAVRDEDLAVTLKVDNMRLEAAVNWILKLVGLGYDLRDECVFISKPDRFQRLVDPRAPLQPQGGQQGQQAGQASLGEDFFGDEIANGPIAVNGSEPGGGGAGGGRGFHTLTGQSGAALRMYDVTDLTIDIRNFHGGQQALASWGGYSADRNATLAFATNGGFTASGTIDIAKFEGRAQSLVANVGGYSANRAATLEFAKAQRQRNRSGRGRVRAPLVSLRDYFPQTAYWNPAIRTDGKGEGSVTFVLPDTTTGWRLVARGITTLHLVGEATQRVVTKKPFSVQMATPAALTAGDKASTRVSIRNFTEDDVDANIDFKATSGGKDDADRRRRKVPKGKVHRMFIPFNVRPGNQAKLNLHAGARNNADGVAKAIPIRPWGIPVRVGASGVSADAEILQLVLPKNKYVTRTLTVSISASLPRSLIDAALDARTGGGCTEQTIAGGLIALSGLEMLDRLGQPPASERARLEGAIEEAVRTLGLTQKSGGWTWAFDSRIGTLDPFVAAYALEFLKRAERKGFAVPKKVAEAARQQARKLFSKANALAAKAALLYGMSFWGDADYSYVNRLDRLNARLDSQSLALLVLTFLNLDRNARAGELADVLLKRSSLKPLGARPGKQGRCWVTQSERVIWRSFPIEATALAVEAVQRTMPRARELREAVDWLFGRRVGTTWGSARATAAAVRALATYVGATKAEPQRYTLDVLVNRKKLRTVRADGMQATIRIDVPEAAVRDSNRVDLKLNGRGQFAFTATLEGITDGVPEVKNEDALDVKRRYEASPRLFEGLEVPRGYSVVQGPHTAVTNPVAELPEQKTLDVRLEIRAREGERYVVVEDYVPAGTAVIGHTLGGNYDRYELGDNRVTFYYSNADGSKRLVASYRLSGRFRGEYRALPARAYSFYSPYDLRVGAPKELAVLPKDGTPKRAYVMTPDELYHFGKKHYDKEDYKSAQPLLAKLFTGHRLKDKPFKDTVKMLLYIALAREDSKAVVDYFEILKERYPELVIPFDKIVAVGRAYRERREHERAVAVFRAIAGGYYFQEGQVAGVLETAGEFLAATEFVERLLGEYPDLPVVQSGLYSLAQQIYTKLEKLDSDERLRKRLSRKDLLAKVRGLLTRFLALYPDNPIADEVSFALASSYLEDESYDKAIALCEALIERYPKSPLLDSYQYIAGYSYFVTDRPEPSLALCRKVAKDKYATRDGEMAPSDDRFNAIHMIAQVYHASRQHEKALAEYDKVKTRFADAAQAIAFLKRRHLALPEVTTVVPGNKPTVELTFRNVAACDLKVYKVDLMTLYLLERNLSKITRINLAGIKPQVERTVKLGDGKDYEEKTHALELAKLAKPGAYLIVCKSDEVECSGMLLVSSLSLRVQEDVASGRMRVNVRDEKGDYQRKVHVKVIGSENKDFKSGHTDLRGVFEATGVKGLSTIIARKGDHYAFHRGEMLLAMALPGRGEGQQPGQAGEQAQPRYTIQYRNGRIVVVHTPEVHQQIEDLLVAPAQPAPTDAKGNLKARLKGFQDKSGKVWQKATQTDVDGVQVQDAF